MAELNLDDDRFLLHLASLAPLYVETCQRSAGVAPDRVLGAGTAFIVGRPDPEVGASDIHLVTARHVLSGRDAVTGDLIDQEPDFLRVHWCTQDGADFKPVIVDYPVHTGTTDELGAYTRPKAARLNGSTLGCCPLDAAPPGFCLARLT